MHGEFNILGGIEVIGPRGPAELAGGRRRALVAALALRPGRVVPLWRLVEALWGERPPRTAVRSLHSHVARLRPALDAIGLGGVVQTREPGYLLAVEPTTVDAHRFEHDLQAARAGLAAGLSGWAVEAIERALGLWRGEALADAEPVGWTAVEASRLEGLRFAGRADRCEALLGTGRYGDAVGEMERLLNVDPTRERLVGLYMIALAGAGRTTEALDTYHRLRVALADELGVDPSPELTDLHTALLRGTAPADLRPPGSVVGVRAAIAAIPVARPRPAQLPAPVGYFTGRVADLCGLDTAVAGDARPVVLICGPGGVGKTSLAVEWGIRHAARFPDGQVFVDVRGHDRAAALAPPDVVAVLLRCLGVPDDLMPAGVPERIALYRSILAGKRMLVVLDNAGSTEQVLAAVPGGTASLLVVTSRNSLAALVTHVRVHPVWLDVFSTGEAVELLTGMLGAARVDRERAAVHRLVELCDRLPLALRIAAAKLVMRPEQPVEDFARELSDGDRLAALSVEDGSRAVGAVFASAYRSLPAPGMRLFRLLSEHPGPHVSAPLATALGAGPAELADLVAAHLLAEPRPGRYRFHDLSRLYARACALADEPADARRTAAERMVDWYLVVADAANRVLDPSLDRVAPRLRHPAPDPPFPDARAPVLAFLDSERENFAPIVQYAAGNGQHAAAAQLTYLLTSYFDVYGNWSERVEMCRHAVGAARRVGDLALEAEMWRALGVAYRATHQPALALDCHHRALVLLRRLGDEPGLAYVYNNIGGANVELRRFGDAMEAYRTALHLHTRCGSKVGVAAAQRNIGYVHIQMGDAELSFAPLAEALAASRVVGYHRLEASTLNSLGEAYREQRRHDRALECFRDALEVSRTAGDRRYQMVALGDIGRTYLERGDPTAAIEHLARALVLSREIGHRHIEACTLNQLGEAHLRLGDLAAAEGYLTASADLRETLPDPYEQAHLHRNLGDLAELTGRPDAAARHRATAGHLSSTVDDADRHGGRVEAAAGRLVQVDGEELGSLDPTVVVDRDAQRR